MKFTSLIAAAVFFIPVAVIASSPTTQVFESQAAAYQACNSALAARNADSHVSPKVPLGDPGGCDKYAQNYRCIVVYYHDDEPDYRADQVGCGEPNVEWFTWPAGTELTYEPANNVGCPGENECANPVNSATGNKFHAETDARVGDAVVFSRYYNSGPGIFSDGLGSQWRHSFSLNVRTWTDGVPKAQVSHPDGRRINYSYNGSVWSTGSVTSSVLDAQRDTAGAITGWTLTDDGGVTTKRFDAAGRLTHVETGRGQDLALTYSDGSTSPSIAPVPGLLIAVTDARGRGIGFVYNSASRIVSVTTPDGAVTFGYASNGNLSTVTRPDSTVKTYQYNEPAYVTGSWINALTGIIDENGDRFATYTYDDLGRVNRTHHGSGVNVFEIEYTLNGPTKIQQPDGSELTRLSQSQDGKLRPVSESLSCEGCQSRNRLFTYDSAGNLDTSTDARGTVTDYDFDANRLLTRRVDGANLVDGTKRTTQFDWHSVFDVVTERRIYDALNVLAAKATFTYNSRGQVATFTEVNPITLATRATSYSYCESSDVALTNSACPILGLLKSVNGPLTGNSDIMNYAYRSADDLSGCSGSGSCYRKGDLFRATDGFGTSIWILDYDLAGRPRQLRDSNMVISDLEYDPRGRLTARKVRGATAGTETDDAITRLEYDGVGQLTKVTQPDGAFFTLDYDDAQRLTGIEDSLGNSITYGLDGAGNRFKEETRDDAGVLRLTLDRLFNQFGELETVADAFANPTDFTYDSTGSVDTMTNPLGRTTDNVYDALGRLREIIANVAGAGGERSETQLEYDALDNLTAVIDPKGLATEYVYDGLGNLVELQSPDTGTATYGYDKAGNRTSQIDARGIQSNYTYDRLNRLTLIDVPTAGKDVSFSYDSLPGACQTEETFSIGRLSTVADPSGGTTYCYDRRGNVVRKVQAVTGGATGTVGYSYNKADGLVGMTYPSGATVTYTRNAAGRITGVEARAAAGSAPVTLITDIDYAPFGPVSSITWGNGRVLERAYDLNYGIDAITDSAPDGVSIDYGLNDLGMVTALDERLNPGAVASRTAGYDALDRLESLNSGATALQAFTYDATGNRLSKADGGTTTAYTYPATSHRLTQTGTTTRSFDPAGNGTGIGAKTFTYDDQGRRVQYRSNGVLLREYAYNGRGERVAKRMTGDPANDIFFVYDEAGRLLGDYAPDGSRLREYVWVDDMPVAMLNASGTVYFYLFTDHLNTPRAAVRASSNEIVWRWDITGSAFGEHEPDRDPEGDNAFFNLPLRYPGQYYDGETGLHYNYFRDFDPATGRYLQSDPLGIAPGPSTYTYVSGAPFSSSDPSGLIDLMALANLAREGGIL